MMPTLQHFGVGCIPWSPLAAGSKSFPRLTHQNSNAP